MLKMTHLPNRSGETHLPNCTKTIDLQLSTVQLPIYCYCPYFLDRVVHDALYHEFYNYCRHPDIRLYTDGDKRFAYVKLKT